MGMLHMRANVLALLVVAASLTGCLSNMDELKEALGVQEPPPPPPVWYPPEARAQVNATSVLTGVPVRFSAEGSKDPQGLPLLYQWTLGEARKDGAIVTHAFPTAGEWRVTLQVINEAGLSDATSVIVQVAQGNRAPTAVLELLGVSAGAIDMGDEVRFNAAGSSDPDGDDLTYDWDFGDGDTSHDASPRHAFDAPGLYTIKLRVSDAAGGAGTASKLLAVNGAWSFESGFAPTQDEANAHTFLVADGARELRATLTFSAALGGNDAILVLKDASGGEVARTEGATKPGAQGDETREIVLAGEALRALADGTWTAEVVKVKGLQLDYTLVLRETF